MSFAVDQFPSARDGDVIRRLLIQCDGEELAECERIGQAPSDAAFAVQALEEADHHDAEIPAGRQRRASEIAVIEVGASGFTEGIERGVVEDLIEPLTTGMAGCCG
jgi:hypothetical protein